MLYRYLTFLRCFFLEINFIDVLKNILIKLVRTNLVCQNEKKSLRTKNVCFATMFACGSKRIAVYFLCNKKCLPLSNKHCVNVLSLVLIISSLVGK